MKTFKIFMEKKIHSPQDALLNCQEKNTNILRVTINLNVRGRFERTVRTCSDEFQ